MKTRLIWGGALSILLTTATFAISEADLNKIVFANNLGNGKSIEYIFFSPADSDYWGPDVLDKEHNLLSGQKAEFYIFYPDQSGIFDFMAVDNDGIIYEMKKIEIKDGKTQTVSINEKNKTGKNLESLNMSEVVLSNDTEKELSYIFLAPADSKMWGLELLNTERTLEPGAKISFLVLLAGENFDMDFLTIDSENNNYQKTIPIGTEEDTLYYSISQSDLNTEE